MRKQGRIRRHHDDDRTLIDVAARGRARALAGPGDPGRLGSTHDRAGKQVRDLAPDGRARDLQPRAEAVVALHEHADRERAGIREHAGRGADPSLELMAHHPRAPADVALGHRPARRAIERLEDVLVLHVKAVDVVEGAVVGLRDHRQAPGLHPRPRDLPLQDRVAHHAHAVRVRDRDRAFQDAALLEPRRARHLAVAVEREPGTEDGIGTALAARMHDGHAGAHRTLPHHEGPVAGDERRVADFDARDIGDRVEGSGRAADERADAELSGARLGGPTGLRPGRRGHGEANDAEEQRRPHPDQCSPARPPAAARSCSSSFRFHSAGVIDLS